MTLSGVCRAVHQCPLFCWVGCSVPCGAMAPGAYPDLAAVATFHARRRAPDSASRPDESSTESASEVGAGPAADPEELGAGWRIACQEEARWAAWGQQPETLQIVACSAAQAA